MQDRISTIIEKAIAEKVFPACVVGFIKNDEHIVLPFGNFTYEKDSPKVLAETLFDVASITKAIPTSLLALQMIDQDELSLDDFVIKYIPEFSADGAEQVTIRHLLTQTVDYNFTLSLLKEETGGEIVHLILTTPLKSPPGQKFQYTNTSSILLGVVIERIANQVIERAAKERIFKPLQMNKTTFTPELFGKENSVPTEIDGWRGKVQGEVHDESAWIIGEKMKVGSAGLFSTVPDLLQVVQMFLQNGLIKKKKFLSADMIAQIETNQVADIDAIHGLGWELQQPYMGKYATPKTFGKTGFTGCMMIVDRGKKTGMVMLSNYTYPKRKKNPMAINEVRKNIANILFE